MGNKLCECGCEQPVRNRENRFINGHSGRGKHPSAETRRKISASNIGLQAGENNPFYGKKHTEEAKKKISKAAKGRRISPETRRRISKATKGENHPMYGKHHTEETRRKISNAKNGEKHTDETKGKMSIAQIERWKNPDEHKRMSIVQSGKNNPFYGKHHSAETKRKMSASHIGLKVGKNNPMFGKSPAKGSGRGKGSYCKKGHWVRSTWEGAVADWLFENDIEYQYEPERFVFNPGISYLPDFFIPQCDLYIEVKGYMRLKNKIQHKLFERRGYNLLVIDKNLYPDFEYALANNFCINRM